MSHRLRALLAPRSLAFVGASTRPDSIGRAMVRAVLAGGFAGAIHPVNPRYETIEGLACHPSLADLPEPVEHVVLALADHRIEAALGAAIEAGAKAATIFGACHLEGEEGPRLTARLAAMAREAGLSLCGANCMGFYNVVEGIYVSAAAPASPLVRGGVALILHSGSVYGAMADDSSRLDYSYVVSSGQELTTSAADYLDYVLDDAETRVIGLLLETVRDPEGFRAALEKARGRDVAVVALKVGRTEAAAQMAFTHSGAMVGDAAAYDAVFAHHGVITVETLDEFAATLALFAQPRRAGAGGVASIHDSGGEREMLADLAADLGVPLARIGAETRARLAARLEAGLEPGNPLDAWGTGHDYEGVFRDCFQALIDDPDTAIGLFNADIGDDRHLSLGYARAAIAVARASDKPVALGTNLSNLPHPARLAELRRAGVPLLEGTAPSLLAARHLLEYRDFRDRPPPAPPPGPGGEARARWRARLARGGALDEAESLALLADYGLAVPAHRVAETEAQARAAAHDLGYPVALKTAQPGILHKSDRGGVRLGLADAAALARAYRDLAGRLGPRVLVARMAPGGVEMALGLVRDAQFGPLVMVAGGGVFVEVLGDRRHALAPLDAPGARRLLDGLRIRPLLGGLRGAPAADIDGLARTIARFSVLAAELGDLVAEADVNPVIAAPEGAIAVDALFVPVPR